MNNRKVFSDIIKFLLDIFKIALNLVFTSINELFKNIRKRLRFSITFKITTVYTAMFTQFLFLITLSIWGGFIAYEGKNLEDGMLKNYKLVSSFIKEDIDTHKKNIDELSGIDAISITIFDQQKNIIYTTEKDNNLVKFYDKSNSENISNSKGNYLLSIIKTDSNTSYKFTLILNEKTTLNSRDYNVQITNELSEEISHAIILILVLIILDMLFILMTIASGSRTSKKMLKPIDTMTKTVKNITINALDTRLDISGSQDELKELAETFNNMLDRIQHSYELQNQFVSDASHELRTPISVIQGYINILDRWGKNDKAVLEESILAIKTEAESMKDLIEKLLFLARGDKNTQKFERENFYVNELINEIIKETKLIDSIHEIFNEKNEQFLINADRNLLKEAIRVFVDNSIKYTPEGGTIKISSYLQKNQAVIVIEDTGIGIPKDDLPNIFNRFYRTDKSRTKETGGTGLGLAIAKWIILKHKGTIEVQSSVNIGTKISLLLPLSS